MRVEFDPDGADLAERRVLAEAMRLHLQDRVLLNREGTV